MQADGWLVEHVHDAGQAGADLRGQADALRLAAGQRFGRAFQAQVVEADVDQEAQAGGDFLEDFSRPPAPWRRSAQAIEEVARLAERQAADLVQRLVADADMRASVRRRVPAQSGRSGC